MMKHEVTSHSRAQRRAAPSKPALLSGEGASYSAREGLS